MYDFSDEEPTSSFPNSYYGDFSEILETVKHAIQERNNHPSSLELLHGYHRVDPKRGSERFCFVTQGYGISSNTSMSVKLIGLTMLIILKLRYANINDIFTVF